MSSVDERGGVVLEQVRAGVLERLRARRSEIEQAIFVRVRDLAPGAVGLEDPEYLAGLRAAIAAGVDFVFEGLEQRTGFSPRIPPAAMAQARRAARVGAGLDTMLRRYVAGLAVLEDFIMQEADHSALQGQRTALRQVLEASASLLDRLIPSITSAYMQELERAGSPTALVGEPSRLEWRTRSASAGNGASSTTHEHVVEDQRARIMRALVEVLAERGVAGATVGLVVARAKVSTRTFYQLFDGLDECLIAIMDGTVEHLVALAAQALENAERWEDGLRSAFAAVLTFFDTEPELARVCIVETLAGGSVVLAHRQRAIAAFRLPILERMDRDMADVSPLTAEGVMSSVLGIMHAHIVAQKPGAFIELLGPLMGLAMAPYLGAQAVQQEIEQGDRLAQAILNGDPGWTPLAQAAPPSTEPDAGAAILFADLGDATARRLRECLVFLAEHPDSSNREVGIGIDLVHQSQISKLLAHLLQGGLASKRSEGKGKRNAWRLTPQGEEIAHTMMQHQA